MVFWNVTPWSLIPRWQTSEKPASLKKDAASSSEAFVTMYQYKRRLIPDDNIFKNASLRKTVLLPFLCKGRTSWSGENQFIKEQHVAWSNMQVSNAVFNRTDYTPLCFQNSVCQTLIRSTQISFYYKNSTYSLPFNLRGHHHVKTIPYITEGKWTFVFIKKTFFTNICCCYNL